MRALEVVLVIATASQRAAAHPGHDRSSRLVKVDLAAEPPRLRYGLVYEPAASDAGRKRADQDDDGRVTPREADEELARLTEELRSRLRLCRGVSADSMACSKPTPDQVLLVHATGFSEPPGKVLAVLWEFSLRLEPADRALRVEDSSMNAEVDRTDVAIEPPEGVELTLAGPGTGVPPRGVVREFKWNEDRPGQPRQVFVAWPARSQRWWLFGLAGAAALAMMSQLLGHGGRRQRAS